MLRISELLSEEIAGAYKVTAEKEVEYLALAGTDTDFDFCTFLVRDKYIESISDRAVMVITTAELAEPVLATGRGVCVVENPRNTFFRLHNSLATNLNYRRSSTKTVIGKGCNISDRASIAENNVVIGSNVTIEDNVVIKENTVIGDNSIIRANCVIGDEGFEFKRDGDKIIPVTHLGGVIIGENVEIHGSTAVDRAVYPWDNTVLGDYTKLANQICISHAVKIGKACLIAAGTVVGGRTVIGDKCWIGLSAVIRNGLVIGNNASVNMGAVVTQDVPDGMSVSGNFAMEHGDFIKYIKARK